MAQDPFEEFEQRRLNTQDEARDEAVKKRHSRGGRTARENLDDLVDGFPVNEFGQYAVAAQRSRKDVEELQIQTAGDGVITAIGSVNSNLFDATAAKTALIINDYTVLAGTQGYFHHRKIDRLLGLAGQQQLPVVMYTEGGGGRPGDTDVLISGGGLNVPTFHRWCALTGKVPRIAVNHGFCFAGNAALFGAADLRIATQQSYIGMAGPAMIEGGGLGSYQATDIGPSNVHTKNGVIDIVAQDEAQATSIAKQALAYCQGPTKHFDHEDQSSLRSALPANRRMAYNPLKILERLFDNDSFLPLRPHYGRSIVTGLARIEGIPFAVLANDCRHLGGAIDSESASKATDLYRLADRWKLPVVSFVDTPGFMVGPDSESTGAPRHMSEMFTAGATLTQPIVAIFLRRGYGLGAMAMTGGSFEIPVYAASWPTGEFGPMGLEGAVHLGYKQELAKLPEGPEREAHFEALLAKLYERGKATEAASFLEIDSVIDPVDTRSIISSALLAK
ncbi:biotin carboxylase [Luminiphilus sp.]|nr:biotin carboxylase [Luminiphilus sp.]